MDKKLVTLSISVSLVLFCAFFFPLAHGQNAYLYPYSVQSGDTLSLIGSRFGVSWNSIATYNGISSPYTIHVGESILIPLSTTWTSYTVQSGDSLYLISQEFETSWQSIAQANAISYPYTIYAGEILVIPLIVQSPGTTTTSTMQTVSNIEYTVQSGDSLYSIGQALGVSWQTIAQLNGITSPYTIYVGEVLLIPTASTTTSSTTSTTTSIKDPIATGNQLYDEYDLAVLSAASKYNVDPMIIKSQIAQESYFNTLATSSDDPCGQLIQNGVDVGHSYGLLQITPACNSWFARNPDGTIDLSTNQSSAEWSNSAFNAVYNIDSGAFALYSSIQHAKQSFVGCTSSQYTIMGLAGYNSGWSSVYGCGSYSSRASAYTSNVLSWYQTFSSMSGWTNPY